MYYFGLNGFLLLYFWLKHFYKHTNLYVSIAGVPLSVCLSQKIYFSLPVHCTFSCSVITVPT